MFMKVKVDKLTGKEFSEYADSTFAKPVKMSLGIFLGIIMIAAAFFLINKAPEEVIRPLWIAALILALLLISSTSVINMAFKKSGFAETKCSYEFSGDGMYIVIGDMEGDLSWKYIKRVKETQNLFVISAKRSQFIIPKRCIKNEGDFLAIVKEALPEDAVKQMKYKKKEETEEDGNSDNR